MHTHTYHSELANHSAPAMERVAGNSGTGVGPWTWLLRLLKRIERAGRWRRDYATLMAKDERELSDIGLTRGDVIAGFEFGRWPARRSRGG